MYPVSSSSSLQKLQIHCICNVQYVDMFISHIPGISKSKSFRLCLILRKCEVKKARGRR